MTSSEQTFSSDEIDFGALLSLLWSYKYLIVAMTALCTIVAVVLALITQPVYRAEVVVTEVRDSMSNSGSLANQLGGLASLAGVNLSSNSSSHESLAFLKSRSLVEAFIRRYQLLPELSKNTKKAPTMWMAVNKFRNNVLSIQEDVRKGTVTVSVNWRDPQTAARWANDVIALVNELLRNRAMDQAKRNIEYLNEQITATRVVELQRVMYNLIENETKSLMLANVRVEYAFEVVDPAVAPEIRIKPKRTLMVIFGAVLGLLIGIVAAFAHNAYRCRKAAA